MIIYNLTDYVEVDQFYSSKAEAVEEGKYRMSMAGEGARQLVVLPMKVPTITRDVLLDLLNAGADSSIDWLQRKVATILVPKWVKKHGDRCSCAACEPLEDHEDYGPPVNKIRVIHHKPKEVK